jgi:hypothetical protein
MKKLTRLGVIVFIAGISLLVATVYRGNSPVSFGRFHMLGTASDGFVFDTRFLLPPRTCQIQLNATSEVDVYILDEEGITLWEKEGILEPVWNSSGAKEHTGSFEVNRRGEYAQLIFSIYNASVTTQQSVRLSGIENDLLVVSVAVTVSGLATVAASIILKKYWARREQHASH